MPQESKQARLLRLQKTPTDIQLALIGSDPDNAAEFVIECVGLAAIKLESRHVVLAHCAELLATDQTELGKLIYTSAKLMAEFGEAHLKLTMQLAARKDQGLNV